MAASAFSPPVPDDLLELLREKREVLARGRIAITEGGPRSYAAGMREV